MVSLLSCIGVAPSIHDQPGHADHVGAREQYAATIKPERANIAGPNLPSIRAKQAGQGPHRRLAWICLALLPLVSGAPAPDPRDPGSEVIADQESITPIPQPSAGDPLKLALGESLFGDPRLSHDGTLACASCHDIHTNGADDGRRTTARDGSRLPFDTPTIFNAALSFRLNWEGNFRTLEAQAQSALENPTEMATSIDEVLQKLNADPKVVGQFNNAYGRGPNPSDLLDAIATYERSLLTPGSRFDRWLGGDTAELSAEEHGGYGLFKSLGCVSCHQGVNVGGNLYERQGIFHPLAAPKPEILRVPSLRNVATTAPYFHDGSAATLGDAVRKMAAAQLDLDLPDAQIQAIVAFLKTLTGNYQGVPVVAAAP
ncbi:MAG: cytochrome c peroxidase [Acetobacteraceae bacterium]|nr:cytochrome c peroxidase [Acetobacteraceae bacterium]